MYNVNYGEIKDLEKELLYKRIVEWKGNYLLLEDGTKVTIECSEQDCCAGAGGTFSKVKLDAVITNIEIGEANRYHDGDTDNCEVKVTLYHNQNPIAQADLHADAGNGGYYYSVGSFVVKGIHYAIVDA